MWKWWLCAIEVGNPVKRQPKNTISRMWKIRGKVWLRATIWMPYSLARGLHAQRIIRRGFGCWKARILSGSDGDELRRSPSHVRKKRIRRKSGDAVSRPFGMSVDKAVVRLQEEGTLGQVRLVRVQSFVDMFAHADAKVNWRKDHRLSGLNMHTLGMYIEVMHRWFGWTREVTAQMNIFTETRQEESGEELTIEVPDQILAHTTMENGTPVEYTISSAVYNGAERIEIYGSKMTLHYDVFKNTLFEVGKKGTLAPVEIRPEEAYNISPWSVEADFIRAIREGASYFPDFHDGLKYMQVLQAMYDSAGSGTRISLQD